MRLKANITIEVEAEDFVGAAKHQCAIQEFAQTLMTAYPNLTLKFGSARQAPSHNEPVQHAPSRRRPVNVVRYEEYK